MEWNKDNYRDLKVLQEKDRVTFQTGKATRTGEVRKSQDDYYLEFASAGNDGIFSDLGTGNKYKYCERISGYLDKREGGWPFQKTLEQTTKVVISLLDLIEEKAGRLKREPEVQNTYEIF